MVKLIALLKRKPGMSKEAFAKRWLEEHTKLSSQLPGLLEYRINIANDDQADNAEPAFDGTAELWWESVEAMKASFKSEIGKRAGEDADEFCEQRIHIYTEEHFVVKGKA
ncbi:MAG: EthD family reductase [Trueperaceae bacterium]